MTESTKAKLEAKIAQLEGENANLIAANEALEEKQYEMEKARADAALAEAKSHFSTSMGEIDPDDPDADDRADRCAEGWVEAQNQHMKDTDPERYAEMRHMYGPNW